MTTFTLRGKRFWPGQSPSRVLAAASRAGFAGLALLLSSLSAQAQLAAPGTYTINPAGAAPGAAPYASGTNFQSFTQAVNALNLTASPMAGAVTFNVVNASSPATLITEAAGVPAITVSGTSTNPITFQKATAANPNPLVLRSTGNTTTTDAVIAISGGDFITFDGISVRANTGLGTSAVEYGYLVRNASNTNGALNNTIRNATISLDRASTSSAGVLQSASSTGGGVSAGTNASGANQNNTYQNLTITNAYRGIYLISGSTTTYDANTTITGCTIGASIGTVAAGDIGNATTTASSVTPAGIQAVLQTALTITDNTVQNVVANGAAGYGISLEGGFGDCNILRNRVLDVRNSSASSSSTIYGIRLDASSISGSVNTLTAANNFVARLSHAYTGTSTTTRYIVGIGTQVTSSANTVGSAIRVFFNSVRIEAGSTFTGSSTAFNAFAAATTGPVLTVRNNIFSNFSPASPNTTARRYAISSTTTATFGGSNSTSDFNDLYVLPGQGAAVGASGTTERVTLADWMAAYPTSGDAGGNIDANSKTVDPQFVSATDLHAAAPDLNGAGQTPSITGAGLSTDIDLESRQSPPDIGADEFTLAGCLSVTNVGFNTITTTSAQLTFTGASGAQSYTVTLSDGTTTTILSPNPTASPVNLTGLTANTAYTVSIVTNCAGGATSTPAATGAFRTECGTYTAPYSNIFDGRTAPALPFCFSRIVQGGGTGALVATVNSATVSNSAPNYVRIYPNSNATTANVMLVTPEFTDLGGGNLRQVRFSTRVNSTNTNNAQLQVGVLTDPNDPATFTAVGSALSINSTTYQEYVVPLTSYAGTGRFVAFKVTTPGSTTQSLYLDDFFYEVQPACAAPTNGTVISTTSTSASIGFTAAMGVTDYTVTVSDGTNTTVVSPNPTASPVSLTGLTPLTSYTVSIVSNCGPGVTSPAETVTFTSAPVNDEPTGAFVVPVTANCSSPVSGTNTGATTTTANGYTQPGCAIASSPKDVWYTFTTNASGAGSTSVRVEVTGAPAGQIRVFSTANGAAGPFTDVGCAEAPGTNQVSAPLTLAGLTPGTTYYVRIAGYGSTDTQGAFTICVNTANVDLVISNTQTGVQGSYGNVTITGTGNATLGGGLVVAGALLVQTGGTLNDNCFTITGPGSFTLQAGATLGICNSSGITLTSTTSGAVRVAGTRTFSTEANYIYNGTATQTTGNGLPATVRSLTVNNTAATPRVTLTSNLAVSQLLRLQNGNLNLTSTTPRVTLLSSPTNGTALVVNTNGIVANTAIVQRSIDPSLNPGPGYRHYSAPVSNTTFADLTTPGFTPELSQAAAYNSSPTPGLVTPFPNVFGYDESRVNTVMSSYPLFDRGWFAPTSVANPMEVGRGYSVNINASETVDFVGLLNNGDVARPLTRTGGPEGGWHLLGNPYPSPIDYSLVAPADRTGLDAAAYVFESTSQYGGMYRTILPGVTSTSNLIATAQGFFMRVSDGNTSGAFTFRNGQRVTSFGEQATFRRSGRATSPFVQLSLRGAAGPVDEAYIYFEAQATSGLDLELDAVKLANPVGLNLSTAAANGRALSVNALPAALLAANAATVLPLQLSVPQAGRYTLKAAELLNFAAGQSVALRDAATGQTIVLSPRADYAFTVAAAGPVAGRFALVFGAATPTASQSALDAAKVSLYPNPTRGRFTLQVPPVAGQATVHTRLINALGQVVTQRTLGLTATGATAEFSTNGLAAGVYTLQVRAGELVVTKRLVVE